MKLFALLTQGLSARLQVVPSDLSQAKYARRDDRAPMCVTPVLTVNSAISFSARGVTTVRGSLICDTDSRPIAGAKVIVTFPDGSTSTVFTDENGLYVAIIDKTFDEGLTVSAESLNDSTATGTVGVVP